MKNITRAFVLALTLAGSAAYTQINASAQPRISASIMNEMPMPCCPPDKPDPCVNIKK